MGKGFTVGAALAAALSGTSGLAQPRAPAAPPGVLPSQPAGDVCPAGGRNVADTFAPKPAFPEQTRAPRAAPSTGYRVEVVASGLEHPRSLAPLPDGRLLLADAKRRLRIVGRDGALSAPLGGVPAFDTPGPAGIMDVALDPGFARNRVLYLAYVMPKPGAPLVNGRPSALTGRIVRARLTAAGDALEPGQVIYEGGRLRRLLPRADGTLVFTTAFGSGDPGPEGDAPQRLDDDAGKVLRIRTDGSPPPDNPFAGRRGALPAVFAYGLRDADGVAQDARGRIWTVEHGPRGGDELNLIGPGKNYGYPVISYGRTYGEALIDNGLTAKAGLEQPVYYWSPDIAPSGLLVYSGAMFPAWKGDVFVGGLVAQSLVRLSLKDGKVAREEFLLASRCKRVRDVRQGIDGAIYVLTDADDGELLRLVADRPARR